MDTHHREIGRNIMEQKNLTDDIKSSLEQAIVEFKKTFLV